MANLFNQPAGSLRRKVEMLEGYGRSDPMSQRFVLAGLVATLDAESLSAVCAATLAALHRRLESIDDESAK